MKSIHFIKFGLYSLTPFDKKYFLVRKFYKSQKPIYNYIKHHMARYRLVPRLKIDWVLLPLLGLVREELLPLRGLVREVLIPPRDFLLPHEDNEENDFLPKAPPPYDPACIFLLMSSPIRRSLSATNWHRISSLALIFLDMMLFCVDLFVCVLICRTDQPQNWSKLKLDTEYNLCIVLYTVIFFVVDYSSFM